MFSVTDCFLYHHFAGTCHPKLLLTVEDFKDDTPKQKRGNTMYLRSRAAWRRSRGRVLFIIYATEHFFLCNTEQLTVLTVPFLFIFFPQIWRRLKGLRFWLVCNNTSPLNQNQDLPLCSFTCKKLIKKKSFQTLLGPNFDWGGNIWLGTQLQVKKVSYNR